MTTPAWQKLKNLVGRVLQKSRDSTALGGQVNRRRHRLLMSWKLGTLSVAEILVLLKKIMCPRALNRLVSVVEVRSGLDTVRATRASCFRQLGSAE